MSSLPVSIDDAFAYHDRPGALQRHVIGQPAHPHLVVQAMGDDVIDHYTRCAEWEQEEFDRVVTDWEIARGFERA